MSSGHRASEASTSATPSCARPIWLYKYGQKRVPGGGRGASQLAFVGCYPIFEVDVALFEPQGRRLTIVTLLDEKEIVIGAEGADSRCE